MMPHKAVLDEKSSVNVPALITVSKPFWYILTLLI